MTDITRAIKQELLEEAVPEVYVVPARRRKKVKTEAKVDVKTLSKKKHKSRQASKKAELDDIEFVRELAPRRPYQWQGRKVKAIVRPGMPVVFSPGIRSGPATKRSYDEVYGDSDILEQLESQSDEFAYGKKPRLLTSTNPTPNQVPVTKQEPVFTVAPGEAKLLPTVQVLVPQRVKVEETKLPLSIKSEAGDIKVEQVATEQITPTVAVQTVDVKVPLKRKREADVVSDIAKKLRELKEEPFIETVRMEYSETPDVMTYTPGVEPTPMFEAASRPIAVARKRKRKVIDESATVAEPVAEALVGDKRRWGPANRIMPQYRLHPTMLTAAKKKSPPTRRRRRRRRRATAAYRAKGTFVPPLQTSRGVLLPTPVTYHPTIARARRV